MSSSVERGSRAVDQDLTDVVDEASGRSHRRDATLPGTGGPAGNAKLTAWTGLLLLVLVVVEVITVLDVRGMLSWHVAVGSVLVPVALLKTGSTGWRFVRYYTGHREYREVTRCIECSHFWVRSEVDFRAPTAVLVASERECLG